MDLSPQNFLDKNFTYPWDDKEMGGMWFGDMGRFGNEVRV
jgi:hypothetical protein